MSKLNNIYKCNVCGNMVEVLRDGKGEFRCCGEVMSPLEPNSTGAAEEKHIPVIEKKENEIKVSVGSVEHPMQEDHWIEWIELIADGVVYRKMLKPGDKPEAVFCIEADLVSAREHCNLHGLWKSA